MSKEIEGLAEKVMTFYEKEGRHELPWRLTHDPYHVLVSEMMLQQTQVERVVPFYTKFIKSFPTVKKLGVASLGEVLTLWQGLGYNRRAKFLHLAAEAVVGAHGGRFPHTTLELEKLPGIGHYTARAVSTFAFNNPEVFIETNIRTVFTHALLSGREGVADAELLPLIAEALKLVEKKGIEPRVWYAALMDYGSHLKRSGVKINNKSKHYAKQSKFEGSARQLRGAILRVLLKTPATLHTLIEKTHRSSDEVKKELVKLLAEHMISKKGKKYFIA